MTKCETILLLICSLASSITYADNENSHEPAAGVPAFVRSSVESMPQVDTSGKLVLASNEYIEDDTDFGSMFLPLRSAVERAPPQYKSARIPLRDAVEFVPSYEDELDDSDFNGKYLMETQESQVYERVQYKLPGKYDAFQVPLHYDTTDPQPYRTGSPFQQLVEYNSSAHPVIEYLPLSALKDVDMNLKMEKLKIREETDEYDTQKVLCYITNWSFYRKNDGQFVPENLDSNLCTHIIYSFASLDPEHLAIKEFDPWGDIENGLYKRTVKLGNLPVLLSLGGWTDSWGDKYSRLAKDVTSRTRFATQAVGFLQQHGFSGLHVDWNYPKCWQSDCKKGPASDKPNFTKLIEELQRVFSQQTPRLLLGVSVSGYKEVIVEAYELPNLSKAVDFLTVMTYDYHGAWEPQTGHISPLYYRSNDKYPQYNTDYTMQYLVKMGAYREKLILSIPFYGQSFNLVSGQTDPASEGSESMGPGDAGEFTRQPGMLAYYEICTNVRKNKWQIGRDPTGKAGPHASSRTQWVGFDDVKSIIDKVKYVTDNSFGGVAAWTVDLDDFLNKCCSESFPLLKAINRAMGRLSSSAPVSGNCGRPEPPVTPIAPVMTTPVDTGAPNQPNQGHDHSTTTTTTTWWPTSSSQASTTQRTTKQTTTPTSTWWPTTVKSTTPSTTPTTTTRSTTTRRSTTTNRSTTKRTTTTRTTEEPTATSTFIPAPVNVMPVFKPEDIGCTEGEYKNNPSDCSSYYRCVSGNLIKQYCAVGLHWNMKAILCDWPDNAQCMSASDSDSTTTTTKRPIELVSRETTSASPVTTAKTTPSTTRRGTRPPPRRTSTTTTERPQTTTKRPQTTTKRPQTTTTKRTQTTTSKRPPPTTTRPEPESASCISGEYTPHEDCDSFYVCVNGIKLEQSCAPGLQWNINIGQCDWQSNVRCIESRKYIKFLRLTDSRNLNDPCDGDTHVSYPGDCNKYLRCLWGRLEESSCAPGLHWNQDAKNCDWPSNAQCTETENTGSGEQNYETNFVEFITTAQPPRPTSTTAHTTTRPTAPTPPPEPLEPLSGHFKIVCYFTNWAWYRKGLGKYTPDHIDTDLCTHVVYGFAVLDYTELTIKTHDSWADIDNKFYSRVAAMKEKGVKVSLAIGGWNDSAGDKYSRLVRSAAARAKFVRHVAQFIEKHGFEGLDLDWEYPVCWQVECNKGFADEKEGFSELIKELSKEFKPRGWLLSSAVSPSKTVIDAGYDVPVLAKYLDWIAVMTYDFHGQWDKKTGHVAPLYYHPEDDIDFFNANFSINYWMQKGAPANKLVMGMPLYGQSFTLADTKNHGLNARAPGPGLAGEFTRAAGFLAYYEICDRLKNKEWSIVQDEQGRMGPYAFKGNQWVSFDDKNMLRKKSQLIRSLKLAGGMIWALDLDDFKNRCGEGKHPLLNVIRDVLKDPPKTLEVDPSTSMEITSLIEKEEEREELEEQVEEEDLNSINEIETNISPIQPQTEITSSPDIDQSVEIIHQKPESEFKVVCYFTNWAWYRQSGGKFVPEDIDPDLCTHVIYGFAVLNRDTLTIKPHDSWADIDNRFYERIAKLKEKGIRVSIAIGGWNDSAGDKYSKLVRSAAARSKFVKHVIEFIEKYEFEGLDLDWEYPVCWQVDCTKGYPDEKEGFTELVKELSIEFKSRNLLLSSAVSPSKKVIDEGYDVPTLSEYFDWIAVMTYDFHGQWDKKTGHVAPMYEHPDDFDKTFNANFSINYWLEQGADRKKIIMGMPMYGQSFSLADNAQNKLNSPTYGGGEAGEATRARGFLSYYEICHNIRDKNWHVIRDRKGRMGPYAYLRDQWVSFDDVPMIKHKSQYVKAMGLGGAMIWALDLDDFRNNCDCEEYPLLKTINRVLRNYPGKAPKCKLESMTELSEDNIIPPKPDMGMMETTTRRITTEMTVFETTKPTKRPKPQTPAVQKPTVTKPTRPPIIDDLTCQKKIFYDHDTQCDSYYMCEHGSLLLLKCPPGLHWNKMHCDWPQNANCHKQDNNIFVSTSRPSTTEFTIPTQMTQKPTKQPVAQKPTKKPTIVVKPSRVPKPTPPNEIVIETTSEGAYKVVCYFTNWAWYRPGEGKYTPDDIDDSLCTHIIYGFAVLNRDSLTITTHDSWADIDNRFYERVVANKAKGIKVSVAIGGWNDSLGDKYSRLVRNPSARANFVRHVSEFIEKYGFDGLDLDWEYPVCWQVECDKGKPDEKQGFSDLVKELSEEFKPRGWLLSAAVSPSKMVIDKGYDVPLLSEYFDWIAVMTYDFHGHWDKQTGHVAPLYYVPGDKYDYFNGNFSIRYWMEKGAPAKKLVMGMPLYGQAFTLSDAQNRGLNAHAPSPGLAGEFTRAGGFLAYYEICDRVNQGDWTVVRDPEGRIGPYAYKGSQWVSYDDVEEIRRKSKFLKSLGLGGGMVWALDLDDFRGRCGCGNHPLLRTLNQELRGIPGQKTSDCT